MPIISCKYLFLSPFTYTLRLTLTSASACPQESGPELSIADAGQTCCRNVLKPCDFNCIQLVYGHAGDGKTHYITQQLSQSRGPLNIVVNESFTPLSAIKKLKKLPLIKECSIFFNFTIVPCLVGVDSA